VSDADAVHRYAIVLYLSPSLGFSLSRLFFHGKTVKIINNDPGGTAGLRVKA